MKWLIDSMLRYFLLLMVFSLGIAAIIYIVWLKDQLI